MSVSKLMACTVKANSRFVRTCPAVAFVSLLACLVFSMHKVQWSHALHFSGTLRPVFEIPLSKAAQVLRRKTCGGQKVFTYSDYY